MVDPIPWVTLGCTGPWGGPFTAPVGHSDRHCQSRTSYAKPSPRVFVSVAALLGQLKTGGLKICPEKKGKNCHCNVRNFEAFLCK